MSLAERVYQLRKTKGISQEELAEQVGVSRQAVSKWESEQSTPDIEKVILISNYFQVTTDFLLKGVETEQTKEKNFPLSQLLYISSTAFLLIGVFIGFANWHETERIEDVWGSMIIQVIGIAAYYIGKLFSNEKPSLMIKLLNVLLAVFMPLAMFINNRFQALPAPYPLSNSVTTFTMAYILIGIIFYFILYKWDGKKR